MTNKILKSLMLGSVAMNLLLIAALAYINKVNSHTDSVLPPTVYFIKQLPTFGVAQTVSGDQFFAGLAK